MRRLFAQGIVVAARFENARGAPIKKLLLLFDKQNLIGNNNSSNKS